MGMESVVHSSWLVSLAQSFIDIPPSPSRIGEMSHVAGRQTPRKNRHDNAKTVMASENMFAMAFGSID
jgi:hypothetical protein